MFVFLRLIWLLIWLMWIFLDFVIVCMLLLNCLIVMFLLFVLICGMKLWGSEIWIKMCFSELDVLVSFLFCLVVIVNVFFEFFSWSMCWDRICFVLFWFLVMICFIIVIEIWLVVLFGCSIMFLKLIVKFRFLLEDILKVCFYFWL